MPDLIPANQPELLTLTEAAALLRAPIATLRYWRHLGIGPRSFRAGRRILYRASDVRDWIDQQARDDPAADHRPAASPARRATAATAGRR